MLQTIGVASAAVSGASFPDHSTKFAVSSMHTIPGFLSFLFSFFPSCPMNFKENTGNGYKEWEKS